MSENEDKPFKPNNPHAPSTEAALLIMEESDKLIARLEALDLAKNLRIAIDNTDNTKLVNDLARVFETQLREQTSDPLGLKSAKKIEEEEEPENPWIAICIALFAGFILGSIVTGFVMFN